MFEMSEEPVDELRGYRNKCLDAGVQFFHNIKALHDATLTLQRDYNVAHGYFWADMGLRVRRPKIELPEVWAT